MKPACSLCQKPVLARGWCSAHYQRWWRTGRPLYRRPVRLCSVEGCQEKHKGKGYCRKHYYRWLKHGDPLVVMKRGCPRSSPHWEPVRAMILAGKRDVEMARELGITRQRVHQLRVGLGLRKNPRPDPSLVSYTCAQCQTVFLRPKGYFGHQVSRHFCSRSCYHSYISKWSCTCGRKLRTYSTANQHRYFFPCPCGTRTIHDLNDDGGFTIRIKPSQRGT